MKTKENFLNLMANLLQAPENESGELWDLLREIKYTVNGDLSDTLTTSSMPGRSTLLENLNFILDKAEMQIRFPYTYRHTIITYVCLTTEDKFPDCISELTDMNPSALRANRSVPMLFDVNADFSAYSITELYTKIRKDEMEDLLSIYHSQASQISPEDVVKLVTIPIKHELNNTTLIYIPYYTNLDNEELKTLLGLSNLILFKIGSGTSVNQKLKKYLAFTKEHSYASLMRYPHDSCIYEGLNLEEQEFLSSFGTTQNHNLFLFLQEHNVERYNNSLFEEWQHELFVFQNSTERLSNQTDKILSDFRYMYAYYQSTFQSEGAVKEEVSAHLTGTIQSLEVTNRILASTLSARNSQIHKIDILVKRLQIAIDQINGSSFLIPTSDSITLMLVEEVFLLIDRGKTNHALVIEQKLSEGLAKKYVRALIKYATNDEYREIATLPIRSITESNASALDQISQRCYIYCRKVFGVSDSECGKSACKIRGRLIGSELYAKGKHLHDHGQTVSQKYLIDASEAGETRADEYLANLAAGNEAELKKLALRGNLYAVHNLCVNSSRVDETWLRIAAAKADAKAIVQLAKSLYCSKIEKPFLRNSDFPKKGDATQVCDIYECLSLYEYLLSTVSQTSLFAVMTSATVSSVVIGEIKSRLGLLYYLTGDVAKARKFIEEVIQSDPHSDHDMEHYLLGRIHEMNNHNPSATREYHKIVVPYKDSSSRMNAIDEEIKRKKEEEEKLKEAENSYESHLESSSGCFITTATCSFLHKPDDCDELETMRAFRDRYLKTSEDGDCLVKEYYRIAPVIIQRIDAHENREAVYNRLYTHYLIPSLNAIRIGDAKNARNIYIQMVLDLCAQYDVECRYIPDDFKQYVPCE